mmetsp:Transcript_102648/g.162200  ORF Transcript_102648/g.162200 Transcript_102648/m.162200 type:complete len:522 (-) Transcript_102648:102-1667(-)
MSLGVTTAGFVKLREEGASEPSSVDHSFEPLVKELRAVFRSGKTKKLEWRRSQLLAMQKMISENHEAITAAVRADHGGPKLRGVGEVSPFLAAAEALSNLDKWTAPQAVPTPMMVSPTKMGKSAIRQEPKGVVLIISPWNFPFELALHPMVSAIAAGNCCVLKPSEVSKNSGKLLEELIPKYLDTSCIRVVMGAVPETTALLKEHWDHIFYTGNGHVGRVVAKAAAEHITPVTLELGGKSPVIVDKSAKMKTVVERIAMPKFSTNIGQICVSPDYVVIHKDREQEFYDGMKQHIEALFGKDAKQSPHYGRIINSNHVRRIGNILQGSKGEVVTGGLQEFDADARYVPPTIVKVSHADDPLLGEEIFGPVLPVMTFNNIEEAVDKVNAIDDHPLALYVFSQDKKATDYVLNNTTSGGACVNTALEHLLNANLPFGGVGSSGYGTSHGKHGFDEFTHRRAVLDQDTLILSGAAVPPQPPEKMYDFIVKATITGFLTEGQRNMLKAGLGTGAVAAAGMFFRSRL